MTAGRRMRAQAVGDRAVLVDVEDAEQAAALADWARRVEVPAVEVVPAARTVLFDGVDPAALMAQLPGRVPEWTAGVDALEVEVPMTYDGPDLARVAQIWQCSGPEVARRHQEITFTCLFAGFAPGFGYLAGLPTEWAVPRLASPRARVPAGSVALADIWCGVYPTASPGGWLLLGTTRARLWDVNAQPPALLAPGARVRFVAR